MPIKERLGRLPRIGLHEAGVRLWQIQAEEMYLLPNPADLRHRLAEIHLRMARRVGQRHEDFPPARPLPPHMILHHRVAAAIAMLVAQPFEDPLGGVLLFGLGPTGPPPGSPRSPASAAPASVCPLAASERNRAAPSTGTSWQPCPGSGQRPGPPPADYAPAKTQTSGPPRRSPPRTSPGAPP